MAREREYFKTNPENARIIKAMMTLLEDLSPGEIASYKDFAEITGDRTIRGNDWRIQTAIRKTEKLTSHVYANVRGVGYKRLETKDLPGVGRDANLRIRRKAKNTARRLAGVRANDMTDEERAKLQAYRAHFGMIASIANEASVNRLAREAEDNLISASDRDRMMDRLLRMARKQADE